MELGDVALGIYVTILSSGLATLFWARLNRIDDKLERVEGKLERKADKDDIVAVRTELAGLRSDITQVALAVGAHGERRVE